MAVKKFLKDWGVFTLLMVLLILSRLFLWGSVTVQGHSMDPTLADGEKLITLSHTSIDRFDIVVTDETDSQGKVTKIVKRVIGLPGDTIAYQNDVLTINGETVEEPYLQDYLTAFRDDRLQSAYSYSTDYQGLALAAPAFTSQDNQADFSVTVPEGQYFLLGDNRIVSKDSRSVGTFSRQQITGEVKFRFWPLDRLGGF